jgi:toxin ParE1/3/4
VRLTLNDQAATDIDDIRDYIAQDNPGAAARVATRILSGLSLLAAHPHMGRPGRVPETREFIFANLSYIGVYRVHADIELVEVLRIVHAAQYYPPDEN